MTRAWAAAVCLFISCQGCSPYFVGLGHDAAAGAVTGLTTPDSEKRLTDLSAAATKAARDELLGPTTQKELHELLRRTGATTREEVDKLLVEVVRARVRQAVRAAIDEALGKESLGELSEFREELLGAPLDADLNAAIDAASPHLAQAVADAVRAGTAPLEADVAAVKANADAESQKWKPIAIGFGVGAGLLLACLVAAGWVLRSHHKTIKALQRGLAARA